jgi:hypothetical protein
MERPKRARKSLLILQKRKRGAKGPKSARKRAERATLAQSAASSTIVPKILHPLHVSNTEKRGIGRQIAKAINLKS